MPRKLLATLAIPLLLATACSGDDEGAEVLTGESALAALQSSPDAVAEAGSGRVAMTMDMSLEGEEMSMEITGEFVEDRFRMVMDMSEIAAQTGEDLPPGFDGTMEMIMAGTSFYLRMPFLDEMIGEEGIWVGMSLEDLGIAGDSLGLGAGTNNPTSVVEMLRGSSGDVEELGTEEIRGVETTGFRAEIDIAQALEEMPDDVRSTVEGQLGDVSGTFPVEVWIDGDGLPRRVSMDMSELMGQMVEGGSVAAVMDFFDYGADIEIEEPDASKVKPFEELFGDLGGSEQFESVGREIG